MNTFEKDYIGKGKAHKKLPNVVTVTIAMAKAQDHIFEYEGAEYLRFEISERKTADQYGNTHAAYVLNRVPAEVAVAEPKPRRSRKKA